MHGGLAAPGHFVPGQQFAQRHGIVAVDQQPQQGALHVGGVGARRQARLQVLAGHCHAPGVLVVRTHEAQVLGHAPELAQRAARRVGGRVEQGQHAVKGCPLAAA